GPAEKVNGSPINVGAGEQTSLLGLVALIESITGRALPCRFAPPRAGDVHDSLASLERAERLLTYQPLVSLLDGLRRTWLWGQTMEPAVPSRRSSPRTREALRAAS